MYIQVYSLLCLLQKYHRAVMLPGRITPDNGCFATFLAIFEDMKHISILVPDHAVLAAVDDPRHVFTAVNDLLKASGRPEAFKVELVGLAKEVKLHGGLYSVHTDKVIGEVSKTDLIFIPAPSGAIATAIEDNKDLYPWIVQQYEQGAEVASLCIGAFLLAATGLMNGKRSSTHWMHAANFRKMFPEVELVHEKIITEEQGIYTSGGAHSYWNLLLYLVEKYVDRDTAIMASKYFVVQMDDNSQSPFIIFKGQKEHDDEQIKKAQEFIEANFHEKITVDQLGALVAISRRNFERRFKKATSNSVVEYIQRVKIEAAKKSLESTRSNVNEIVYNVGYSDPKAFRTAFKRFTGLSPLEYKSRYSKVPVTMI